MSLKNWRALGIYAFVGSMMVLFIGPILWLLSISLKSREALFSGQSIFSVELTLRNYRDVLASDVFITALSNSTIIGFSTVALALLVGVPAAYVLSAGRFRGRASILASLSVMQMLPPIALVIPLYVIFRVTGLLGTRTAVILAYSSFCVPILVWMMKNFFDELPRELEEAASIDGAGTITTFLIVILPLVRTGLVAVGILTLLSAWNEFLIAIVLTNNRTLTLPVVISGYSSDTGVDWGQLSATAILVTLPVIIFSLFVQRHLVTGLSSGAVKG